MHMHGHRMDWDLIDLSHLQAQGGSDFPCQSNCGQHIHQANCTKHTTVHQQRERGCIA